MTTERERDDHGRFSVDEVELEKRRAEVVKLHVGGHSFREIGRTLDIAESQAYRDFKAVMDRTKADADATVDEHRRVSLARLEKAIAVLVPMLDDEARCLDAMDRLDKLEKRRAALLGLDAPTRTEVDATVSAANPTVAARLVRETFGEHAAKRDSAETPRDPGAVPDGTPRE
jgi:hypothetical protein